MPTRPGAAPGAAACCAAAWCAAACCAAAALLAAPPAVAAGGADVAATIVGPSGPVPLGSTVTYKITVVNTGPDAAPGTVGFIAVDGRARVDSVASNTAGARCVPGKGQIQGFSCTFGTLQADADPVLLTVRATVPRRPGIVIAAVQVASEHPDPDPDGANNVAEARTSVR